MEHTEHAAGFDIRVGSINGRHSHDPYNLCFSIGNDFARVIEYKPYKDILIVGKSPLSAAGNKWEVAFGHLPFRFLTKYGVRPDGIVKPIVNEFNAEEMVELVRNLISVGKLDKLTRPYVSVMTNGWPMVTEGKYGYQVVISKGNSLFAIYPRKLIRRQPYQGRIHLERTGLIIAPVQELLHKFIKNISVFADPFAGENKDGEQVLTMEK